MSDLIVPTQDTSISFNGFIRIWKTDFKTGNTSVVVSKKNTVLNQGADLLAQAIVGQVNSKISHFYIGYINSNTTPSSADVVDKAEPNFPISTTVGYLRIPLTYPASFMADAGYSNNKPIFSILLTNAALNKVGISPVFDATSWIREVGLVASAGSSETTDKVFSRATFTPVQNDPSYGLTIAWGIKFTA